MLRRLADRLADLGVRMQVRGLLLAGMFLPALALLVLLETAGAESVKSGLVMYAAAFVLLYVPVCKGLEDALALRNITLCNNFCRGLQEGRGLQDMRLPPEKGAENDFIRLKRNMYWMGRALLDREHRIAGMLGELEEAQRQIMDSIEYAGAIQHRVQIPQERLGEFVPGGAVLWRPRDVVGGDSYWLRRTPGGVFAGVFDCTGHGVPGAFITLIAHSMLEGLKAERLEGRPGEVLARLNRRLKAFLGQDAAAASGRGAGGGRFNDGLEMGLCWLPDAGGELCFSGAGIGLFAVLRGEGGAEVRELRGQKCGVGYAEVPMDRAYAEERLPLRGVVSLHLSTDGLLDQVGGEKELPLGRKRFVKFLVDHAALPLPEQQARLWELFEAHRGSGARRDDVTVLGFAPATSTTTAKEEA